MRFIIRDDAEQASVYVANYVVDRIKHFNPTPSHPFVLGLPTGSSPLGVYKVLVEKYKAGEVRIPKIRIRSCKIVHMHQDSWDHARYLLRIS